MFTCFQNFQLNYNSVLSFNPNSASVSVCGLSLSFIIFYCLSEKTRLWFWWYHFFLFHFITFCSCSLKFLLSTLFIFTVLLPTSWGALAICFQNFFFSKTCIKHTPTKCVSNTCFCGIPPILIHSTFTIILLLNMLQFSLWPIFKLIYKLFRRAL